jgi:hypothetical protein
LILASAKSKQTKEAEDAEEAAEKVFNFVIPSGARNPSSLSPVKRKSDPSFRSE